MALAWEYLQRLSHFPHRGSATPQEAAAAAAMQAWLTKLGYEATIQPFRTPRDTLYLGPTVVAVGFLLAAWLGWYVPWAGLLCSVILLVPLVGEMLGSRVDLDLLLPRYRSQNVVARSASSGPAARTLVIAGHYDTQRASYLFHPKFVPFLQSYFYLVYLSLLLVPVGVALRWALPGRPWTTTFLLLSAALLGANAAFLLLCRLTGRYINGANDNGSGAALVLALAERFARAPAAGTELIFVLTGAEEVGTRGMKAFVRQAGLDVASTMFINLDNLGSGTLHYLTGEGMLVVMPYGQQLLHLAKSMASERPEQVKSRGNLLLPTDGLVASLAGYEAISFLAFDEKGGLPNYHWYTDRLEKVDQAALAFAESFLEEYVRRAATTGRATM